MTTTIAPTGRPVLRVALPVDVLAQYAGLIGLVTAALAIAGVLASTAYLSAWHVPAPVIRLDPVTAALRSDAVIYQALLLAAIVFGVDWVLQRLETRPRMRRALGALVGVVLALVSLDAARTGVYGPALAAVGAVGLLALHQLRRVGSRGALIGFLVLVLASAWQTGEEMGQLMRDDVTPRVSVSLTTRSEVAGLGGTATGSSFSYTGLYLVFRDGESIYVGRGVDRAIWIVPSGNVMSLTIGW